jgi:catechol 2,3-dioxygenase-like lactoylglutathione lyase family enzyme
MSVSGFDHVYVETRHFERTIAFWESLGFAVAESWGEGDHRACRLSAGTAWVVLAEAGAGHDPQRATVHLKVTDPEALDARIREADAVSVISPLEETHWGTRWIRVHDPDGNLYVLEAGKD